MAKRKAVVKVDSTAVMGEGSYVKFRPIKYGDAMEAQRLSQADDEFNEEKLSKTHELVVKSIVEWDWVDDDDNELPIPTTGDELGELLYAHEVQFLVEAMLSVAENQRKN